MCKLLPNPAARLPAGFHPPLRLLFLLSLLGLLNACAGYVPRWDYMPPWAEPAEPEETVTEAPREVSRHRFPLGKDDSVIGQLATVEIQPGDTLVDIARHFGLGLEEMGAANPGLDLWVPEPGSRAVLPLQYVLPDAPRKGLVINLAGMRLFSFSGKARNEVVTYPVGVGKEGRSTPIGDMYVQRKAEKPTWYVPESIRRDHQLKGDPLPAAVPPGPNNPLGDYAMYLSRPRYLIHGTDKPYSIGLRASNGCLRLYPENIGALFRATPLKMPVRVVNQPYLIGWLDGRPYLEARSLPEELNGKAQRQNVYAKLKEIETKRGLKLDWKKIESVLAEARGIPVPVAENTPDVAELIRSAVALEAPGELYGRPVPPSATAINSGWHIRVLDTDNELLARRTAAVLNHLGPRIPARTAQLDDGSYRVVAGPYDDERAAKKAARQLAMDFELKGEIVPPPRQQVAGAQ